MEHAELILVKKGVLAMVKELSRGELLDKIEKAASKLESEIHGCGRCTLVTLMQSFELADESSAELIAKAILPLSGGAAQACGALLGGMMAIGMAFFPGKAADVSMDDIQAAITLVSQYYRKFEKELGNVRCFDIRAIGLGRGFDTADPGEFGKFVKAGGMEFCSRVVGKAARLAAEYILNIREQQAKG